MRIIVIGAVAAGTSAAAKARRNDEEAEIVIYDKDRYISYSGCGMPYYLGKFVEKAETLTPRDPAFFKKKYNVDVLIRHEVLGLDAAAKQLTVKNLESGEVFTDNYDKLVLATGAKAVLPPLPGVRKDHVFVLRNIVDMNKIDAFLTEKAPRQIVIVGTGFIGLELCENFVELGLDVTLVEMLPQVTPGLDPDMAVYVEEELLRHGVKVFTGNGVQEIGDGAVRLANGETLPADMVIMATGVKPEVTLAREAGLEIGETGAIRVNARMQTSETDIYACGDCIEQFHVVTGKPVYRPLGSTANKTGRIAGECVTGGELEFRGVLGTGIFRVFDLAVAQTGLSEREALAAGYDVQVSHNIKPSRAAYLGGKELVIKALADRVTGRILGAQIIGEDGVDKRIDVFVTAISFGAKAEDLFHLDLAYAPPFSTTKDPVMYSGMILDNAISKHRAQLTAQEVQNLLDQGEKVTIIDTRVTAQFEKDHIDTALSIPHEIFRTSISKLDKDSILITYCNKGVTGNATQNILINHGFKRVFSISGGHKTFAQWRKLSKKD